MKIIIINGPNLNLLGTREPSIYGNEFFTDYLGKLRSWFPEVNLDYYQSNLEGELVTQIQKAGFSYEGIILNAAGYTHTSVAIADAILAVSAPVVEVHISNIFSREEFRRKSLLAPYCAGTVGGFGLDSYRLAILSFMKPV
ncbi:MAG TPA: type II 3-dehydroquinate dehydratase [Bacteroidales bacterium]|nr:type II 3-dehydroquinate dehydratase [Bacteroidales bacterium]